LKGNEVAEDFEARLRILLPDQYQDSYNEVEPVPMRSAGLKFGTDGKVAWDEIWGSFCDLAMAGGPPHKGRLLEPGSLANIAASPASYEAVALEICRGIDQVSGLGAELSDYPGWIHVYCTSNGQAGWLARAIGMENVAVGLDGMRLYLPAGPDYRLEKEIKNVVTVTAKTCHYWFGHTSLEQRRAITKLLQEAEMRSPLLKPVFPRSEAATAGLTQVLTSMLEAATPFRCTQESHRDWLGLEVQDVKSAIWLMRTLVVKNVLARREECVVLVPLNPIVDPKGEALAERVISAYHYGVAQNMFPK
jgi:sirohydrochlorin cobaltochelatase